MRHNLNINLFSFVFAMSFLFVQSSSRAQTQSTTAMPPCALNDDESPLLMIMRRNNELFQQAKLFMPNLKVGPNRTETYDPSYGYEKYWAGGAWLLPKYAYHEGDGGNCGANCKTLYLSYGEICGRTKNNAEPASWKWRTFKNYCEMARLECNNIHTPGLGWLVVHKGKCLPQLKLYTGKKDEFLREADNAIYYFDKKYDSARTPPSATPTTKRWGVPGWG